MALPTFTVAPTVDYGAWTRMGPSNTPIYIRFTVDDADPGDTLTYELRSSATPGGGNLYESGTANKGTQTAAALNTTATGLANGANTIHVHIKENGAAASLVSSALSVLRDSGLPSTPTTSPTSPTTSPGTTNWTITVTPKDAGSNPAVGEMKVRFRPVSGSGSTSILYTGIGTVDVAESHTVLNDTALVDGANSRWLQTIDGAGNVRVDLLTVYKANIYNELAGIILLELYLLSNVEIEHIHSEVLGAQESKVVSSSTVESQVHQETSGVVEVLTVTDGTDTSLAPMHETTGEVTLLVLSTGSEDRLEYTETTGLTLVQVTSAGSTDGNTWTETTGIVVAPVFTYADPESTGVYHNETSDSLVLIYVATDGVTTDIVTDTSGTVLVSTVVDGMIDTGIWEEVTGAIVALVVTDGDIEYGVLQETTGEVIIGAVMSGLVEPIWGPASHYLHSTLVSEQPYIDSTLTIIQ